MSKYTITIKNLIDNGYDLGLKDYPIFNEVYRNTLNKHIINYYYENEIGFETAELFKFYLNNTLDLIMPKYNEMYKAQEKALLNILGNVDLYEEANRKNQSKTTTQSNSNNKSQNLFQDTPQGKINMDNIVNEVYATNYTLNKNDINDNSASNGDNNEDFTRHIYGNNGNKYNIDILNDIKSKLNNIDLLIINELNDLFMQIF